MKRLAIVGAGDLGIQLKHLASEIGSYEFVGFFDDQKESQEIIGKVSEIEEYFSSGSFDEIIIGIGYNHLSFKKELYQRLSNIPFATLIHPSAIIDPSSKIGKGTSIYSGTVIDMGCKIGENVLINVGTVIAHDTEISAHCFLSPGVTLAGFVHVNDLCILGIGSTVVDHVDICSGVKLGAGTVVIDSIHEPGLYVGTPQRFIKPINF